MNDTTAPKFQEGEPAIVVLANDWERLNFQGWDGARVIITSMEWRGEWCYGTIPENPLKKYRPEALWKEFALRKLPPDELKDTDQDIDYDVPRLLDFKLEVQ